MQREMLYEEKLELLPGVSIGLVPEGIRVDVPFTGEVSGPSVHGKIDGVDYVLMRSDSVGIVHVHAVITADGGDLVSVEVSGFLTQFQRDAMPLKGP